MLIKHNHQQFAKEALKFYAMGDIRLYMFQKGMMKCKVHNIKMNQGDDPYEIPVPWYLITHPKGNIAIDGAMR